MRSRIARRAGAMTAVQAVGPGPLLRIAAAKPAALLESNGDTNEEAQEPLGGPSF
jgi:hypothetical protein